VSAYHVESLNPEVPSSFAAKPPLGGVTALMGPHAVFVRLGPRALELLRQYASLWWRRFESSGVASFIHMEGEKTLGTNLKGLGIQCSGTLRVEDV
jgi:hypothetical protein